MKVLLENTAQKQRKGGKLEDLWLGPYTIHKHLGKGLYHVVNVDGRVLKKKVNINRLKPFVDRCDTESPKKKRVKLEEPCVISSGEESDVKEYSCAEFADLHLSRSDLDDIEQRRWLNDRVINAAQMLIKGDKELLQVGGLQDPLHSQKLSFEVSRNEFVQILHQGGNHWITISTVGLEHPHVRVYDSRRGLLQFDEKKVIASILQTDEKEIILAYANNQKQPNNDDCGLFAIAFIMAICNDQQPEEQQFDVKYMRPHLVGCLKDRQMRHFPGKARHLKSSVRKTEKVKVFCTCRLPEEGNMICCDCCEEWFHKSCVDVPLDAWNKDVGWTCSKCELMLVY